MSSPVTAHRGIIWAGIAMVVASLAPLVCRKFHSTLVVLIYKLMLVAIIWVLRLHMFQQNA